MGFPSHLSIPFPSDVVWIDEVIVGGEGDGGPVLVGWAVLPSLVSTSTKKCPSRLYLLPKSQFQSSSPSLSPSRVVGVLAFASEEIPLRTLPSRPSTLFFHLLSVPPYVV